MSLLKLLLQHSHNTPGWIPNFIISVKIHLKWCDGRTTCVCVPFLSPQVIKEPPPPPPPEPVSTHTHTHTHMCMHTHIHTCTHTDTHAHAHAPTPMHVHAHTCTHKHTHNTIMHAHVHNTHTHLHNICMHRHIQTLKHSPNMKLCLFKTVIKTQTYNNIDTTESSETGKYRD